MNTDIQFSRLGGRHAPIDRVPPPRVTFQDTRSEAGASVESLQLPIQGKKVPFDFGLSQPEQAHARASIPATHLPSNNISGPGEAYSTPTTNTAVSQSVAPVPAPSIARARVARTVIPQGFLVDGTIPLNDQITSLQHPTSPTPSTRKSRRDKLAMEKKVNWRFNPITGVPITGLPLEETSESSGSSTTDPADEAARTIEVERNIRDQRRFRDLVTQNPWASSAAAGAVGGALLGGASLAVTILNRYSPAKS